MVIKKEKQFNILPAPVGLRKYILYYNILFPGSHTFAAGYTLMPNACATLSLAFDGFSVKAELWGAATRPIRLGAEPNGYRVLLLIQLSPCGLYQITRQNQAGLTGKRLALADIDGELFRLLRLAFITSKNVTELANACDGVLYRRMETPVVSDALMAAAAVLSDSHGQAKVKEAARVAGYCERHLNRLFLMQVGVSMKNYARLARFNHVLKQLQKTPCRFAALAQQAGYFDQAHFDKDFKAISGVSPQTYLETMSDFYYDGTEIYHTISSKEE